MDLVHDRESMDPVHESPVHESPCLVRMAKSLEVRKSFHFCIFIPMEVFKNQEDCPNYLALKDHCKKLKMPGRNILQTVF